MNLCRWSGVQ